MSEAAYKNNPIHATLKQLLDLQQDEDFTNSILDLSEEQTWQIDRVFEIARVVESYLENTPSTLVATGNLSNINNYLQQAFVELSNYRSNKNFGHVTNASAHAENIIGQLSGFASPPTGSADKAISQIVGDLRTRSDSSIKALSKKKDALGLELDRLTNIVAAQAQKIEELTGAVEAQKKEAIAVTAEVRAAYSKAESELRATFGETLEKMRFDYSAQEAKISLESENSLSELRKKEEDAKKIVQVVGNIGVTGNYQNVAKSEADQANDMRKLTLFFFGTGVAIAVAVLVAHLFPSISPIKIVDGGTWELALRLLTALAIATPALYTARESARHRTNSDRAKQRELELASLGPFIELLPQEKKHEIVEKLTDRYFGSEITPHEIKPIIDPKDAVDLAKQAIDGLIKVAK